MKINKTLTALIAGASIGMSGQAFAAGTAAGITITNTTSLEYDVSGTPQETLDKSSSFLVDNKVIMTLTGTATRTAVPGESATYSYTFSNVGNKTQVFQLGISGTKGVDALTLSTVSYDNIVHSVGSGAAFSGAAGSTVELTIDADAVITFDINFDYPTIVSGTNIVDNDDLDILASATAWDTGTDAALTNDNTTAKDVSDLINPLNVLADAATDVSIAYDGIVDFNSDITISTAKFTDGSGNDGPGLSILVVNDPICNADNSGYGTDHVSGTTGLMTCSTGPGSYTPKAIPGALVEFTITAINEGAVTADNVKFTQDLTSSHLDGINLQAGSLSNVIATFTPDGGSATNLALPNSSASPTEEVIVDLSPTELNTLFAKDDSITITFTAIVD